MCIQVVVLFSNLSDRRIQVFGVSIKDPFLISEELITLEWSY